MKHVARLSSLMTLPLLLAACGGGGGGSSPSSPAAPAAPASVNVALPANGATVSATYGNGSTANFVSDGDNATTTNFWAGNVADDSVTIDFGLSRQVTEITVYTNDTSFSSSNPAKYIEVSADNTTWLKTAQVIGGDIACGTYTAGSGKIRCVFSSAQTLRYFRVRVTAVGPSSQHVVEMEALGS